MAQPIDDRPTIARRLLLLRKALGFERDQTGFAKHCHLTRSAVANYESGKRRPSLMQLALLHIYTGVSFEWVLMGKTGSLPVDLAKRLREAEESEEQSEEESEKLAATPRGKRPSKLSVG